MGSQHFGSAFLLIAGTTFLHGAGALAISWTLFRTRTFAERHFGHLYNASLLTSVIVALLAVHLTEVVCWAAFYSYKECFPDFNTSLYFSIVTYTTLGYGDLVLRNEWRLLGGVEALTGSLMLCWSTVILVHVVTKIYTRHAELWEEHELPARRRVHRPDPRR